MLSQYLEYSIQQIKIILRCYNGHLLYSLSRGLSNYTVHEAKIVLEH